MSGSMVQTNGMNDGVHCKYANNLFRAFSWYCAVAKALTTSFNRYFVLFGGYKKFNKSE